MIAVAPRYPSAGAYESKVQADHPGWTLERLVAGR